MGLKGIRSRRGKGELYDEVKSEDVILLLTPTAKRLLDEKVNAYRDANGNPLTRSEYFERWARGTL